MSVLKALLIGTVGLLAVQIAIPAVARAAYLDNTDALPSPRYENEGECDYSYDGLVRRIGHLTDRCDTSDRLPPPETQVESFFDISYRVEIDMGPVLGNQVWEGTSQMHARITALPPSGSDRWYTMEILEMNLWDPANLLTGIRESPTLVSAGDTVVTDLGDGTYRIESFFDVFTELSIDGGPWVPGNVAMHMTGAPEPSTLSLLASLLVLGGLALIRRRRTA
jgi:hypothetical protein